MADIDKKTETKVHLTQQETAEVEAAMARDGFKTRASWAYFVVLAAARRGALGAAK